MNLTKLSWKYLRNRPLNTGLNTILFALGIAIIVAIMLFSNQAETTLTKNVAETDLVVGAKGSPMQIILCSVFHLDLPTGNIPLAEAERFSGGRYIKSAIPLALGDSYRAFRIVGSTREYPALYGGELESGDWWQEEMEVVVGSYAAEALELSIGDEFMSQHGMDENSGMHESHHFKVVGILKPSTTVIDNLILTSVQSIWEVHDLHVEPTPNDTINSKLVPGVVLASEGGQDITSLLIQYRNPMAAIQLPRIINGSSSMQAASPAFETARLFSLLGTGIKVGQWIAIVIVIVAALSIFIALLNSMQDRKYDLAIMRTMGGTKTALFGSVIIEGLLISLMGSIFGLLLGHLILEAIGRFVEEAIRNGITGLLWLNLEIYVLGGSLIIGLISALIPALRVMKIDISKTLAE